jgi:hypothetical protein
VPAARRDHRVAVAGQHLASTQEVRDWAVSAGFEVDADGSIPEQAITAYNETHPDPMSLS